MGKGNPVLINTVQAAPINTQYVCMHMYTLNLSVKVPQLCSQTQKGEQTLKINYGDMNLPAVIVLKHGSVTPQE